MAETNRRIRNGYETRDGRYRITHDSAGAQDRPDRGWWVTMAESGDAIHPVPFRLLEHATRYLEMERPYIDTFGLAVTPKTPPGAG